MSNFINIDNLANNPATRVPICLCLDTSFSMNRLVGKNVRTTGRTIFKDGQTWQIATGGSTIMQELLQGVRDFYREISADDLAACSADIAIVSFDDKARMIQNYNGASYTKNTLKKITPQGNKTFLGEGINMALDMLENRKKEYRQAGISYYQPWLVLMTDGLPNGNPGELNRAKQRVQTLLQKKGLVSIAMGIGPDANLNALNCFTNNKLPPHRLKSSNFSKFFTWLSASIAQVSRSMPGFDFDIDSSEICDWAEIQ